MKHVTLLTLAALTLAACQQPEAPAPANMFEQPQTAPKEEPKPKSKSRSEPQYTGKTF